MVTVMAAVLPLLLTTFAYICAAGVASSFHPKVPGVIICVCAPVVITSAITPDPGNGSVVSFLLVSAVLVVEFV